jgi:peptide-methionine (S)-S-oxide reductase
MTYFILSLGLTLAACQSPQSTDVLDQSEQRTKKSWSVEPTAKDGFARAYFASGCFWCVEAIFESVRGVEEVISGYAGGSEKNPTYDAVSAGRTGHTESVVVIYNPDEVSYATLLDVYYGSHNASTVNGQHPDFGKQYRSAIFFTSDEERVLAEAAKAKAQNDYREPVATEIVPYTQFWEAEAYHQDYERLNPDNPYVQKVSIPRLERFKARFPDLLK